MKKLDYKINTATKNDIASHLKECDATFIPALSKRVNIDDYSVKISDKAILFEAWDKEKLCGMVAAYFNDELRQLAFITSVSVLENYRRLGIASSLLKMCFKYAEENSFKQIRLEVSEDNIPAINFYKNNGFTLYEKKNSLVLMNRLTT